MPAMTFSAISLSSLPPMSGTLTLISSSTTSVVPAPSGSSRMVPRDARRFARGLDPQVPAGGACPRLALDRLRRLARERPREPGQVVGPLQLVDDEAEPLAVALQPDVGRDHVLRLADRLAEHRVGEHLEHLVRRRVVPELVSELHGAHMPSRGGDAVMVRTQQRVRSSPSVSRALS